MKPLIFTLWVALASAGLSAQTTAWQPSPGHTQVPIWPGAIPDPQPVAGSEVFSNGTDSDFRIAGKPVAGVGKVSHPTMTVYSPKEKNTGAAVVVGAGFCCGAACVAVGAGRLGGGVGAAAVGFGSGAVALGIAPPALHCSTYAFSVTPRACMPALSALHSAMHSLAVFCEDDVLVGGDGAAGAGDVAVLGVGAGVEAAGAVPPLHCST